MKESFFLFILLSASFSISAQNTPKSIVNAFFEAFHNQDTTALRNFFHERATIQTISTENSLPIVKEESIDALVIGISSIPAEMEFEEQLKRIKVRSDGEMAQVWSPYEFLVDGKFSHSGVNSFVLVKVDASWKIIHLIDTRRK
jgi:hypothetical protein